MSDKTIISQEETAALLGRPLSKVESDNFALYLEIAVLRLNDLLCISIKDMEDIPADLKLLIARCFATIPEEQQAVSNHGISKKQVEDFSISYETDIDGPMVLFVNQNAAALDKYSQCQGQIISGPICPCSKLLENGYYGNCI